MDAVISALIKRFDLRPLPGEGGLYTESYRSAEDIPGSVLPPRYQEAGRPLGTAIYYLLTSEPDSFSALHRLLSDEIYHFYLGDPIEMLLLHPGGGGQVVSLGQDVLKGQHVQFVVPAGCWQGSSLRPGGRFALLGTSMAPGFSPADFTPGLRADLQPVYPQHSARIASLTRQAK